MNELGIVFAAELLRKLRSKVFWIAAAVGVAAIAFFIEAPVLFGSIARSSGSDLLLAGSAALRARATPLLERDKAFRVVAGTAALPPRVTTAYLDEHGHAGAAVALHARAGRLYVDVYPRDLSAFDGVRFLALAPLGVALGTGLPLQRIERAATVERSLHPLDAKFADARTASFAHGIAFGLIFLLYLAIILASQSVMASVAEEKTSRIAEILVATVSPANLLAGKTLAAAIVAIVQLTLWIATAALLLPGAAESLFGPPRAGPGAGSSHLLGALAPGVLAAFALFFVLGYLQYATIYAAAASLISRTEDLGSVTTPVIIPVIGAFFVAQFALLAPNAPLVVAAGFVPFLSPFVIFTRIAVTAVPWWQTALAAGIDALSVVVCFWAAGRIYRVGMLLYGRVPSPRQILAALRG